MELAMLGQILEALALGGLLGGIGGLLGIGGGILAIPVLVMLYGMNQALAQGTALVMMTPNVLIGFWRYRQRNPFPLRTAMLIGLCSVISTYPAARLAVDMDAGLLKQCFAAFLLLLAAYFLLDSRLRQVSGRPAWPEVMLPLVGVVGGLFAGLFSVGAGIVAAPILVKGFGKKQAVAQGLALALVVPGAVVALWTYGRAGHIDWQLGLPMALGGVCTVSQGVAWAHRLPESRLKQLFALMLITTALLMSRHV
ncbi:hypothetical protein DBR44_15810 [Aquitalea sp. FJL05]|nr:hypothetical protein DBR44_15810 [Aquitalea sp. FJL05]